MNQTLLTEYGGHVNLSKDWEKLLLRRMGYVKRRGTTKILLSIFKDVCTTVVIEEILPEMILNWDQTGVNIVPSSKYTMEKKGAKCVEVTGLMDKRMITAVLCVILPGDFLQYNTSTCTWGKRQGAIQNISFL